MVRLSTQFREETWIDHQESQHHLYEYIACRVARADEHSAVVASIGTDVACTCDWPWITDGTGALGEFGSFITYGLHDPTSLLEQRRHLHEQRHCPRLAAALDDLEHNEDYGPIPLEDDSGQPESGPRGRRVWGTKIALTSLSTACWVIDKMGPQLPVPGPAADDELRDYLTVHYKCCQRFSELWADPNDAQRPGASQAPAQAQSSRGNATALVDPGRFNTEVARAVMEQVSQRIRDFEQNTADLAEGTFSVGHAEEPPPDQTGGQDS